MNVKTVTTKHTKTRKRIAEGSVTCCCHVVDFWFELGGARITEEDLELMEEEAEDRATQLIAEGCNQGDLCCTTRSPRRQREREFHGWWTIAKATEPETSPIRA